MIRVMQAHTQLNRGVLLVSASSGSIPESVQRELSLICDIVFDFEVKMIANNFETRMVVRKFRNAPENLRVYTYRVTSEEGITPETVDRVAREGKDESGKKTGQRARRCGFSSHCNNSSPSNYRSTDQCSILDDVI